MAVNYLHGVETVEIRKGARPVRVVKSGVIALVGIAPKGPKQTLTLVQGETDASQFGEQLPGFNIPQALDAILKQGTATVLVVNVMADADHLVTETNETKVVTSGKAKLAYAPIKDLVITNSAGSTTFVAGTDYSIDDFGNLTVIGTAITEGSSIKATYKRLDGTLVSGSHIIGAITSGVRTGMKLFQESFTQFGFNPKLLIAPNYSTIAGVAAELTSAASKYRGHAFIDAPLNTTPSGVITGRGPSGSINFNTSDKRVVLCYPHMKIINPDPRIADTDSAKKVNFPFSAFIAGVQASVDSTLGYWNSFSNKPINGVVGTERVITSSLNDPSTEANLLNENGVVTYFNSFGSGLRVWGNRSAAWPSDTHPSNFVAIQRTADIVHESVEQAMLPFIDKPITNSLISAITETVNGFINDLIGRDALLIGSRCYYDPDKNPAEAIALGQLRFELEIMPPPPAERISFYSFINIALTNSLAG